jgi:phospholipid-binding lipoprotein MlaA
MKQILAICIMLAFLPLSSSHIFAVSPESVLEKTFIQGEEDKPVQEHKEKPPEVNKDSQDTTKAQEQKPVETEQVVTEEEEEEETIYISDPLYPWNKAMYHFNDKLYFWVLKPAAQGYSKVFPEDIRIAVSNFFNNITTPIRFVSSLLQLKMKDAGNELLRFVYNSTAGVGGLADAARADFNIKEKKEDIGQAIGKYGIGHGFYIVWPFIGPSSLRDTFGKIGDSFLDPVSYITPIEDAVGILVYDEVNETSLYIGDYEDLKKSAIDPYVSIKDAYVQYRKKKVEE